MFATFPLPPDILSVLQNYPLDQTTREALLTAGMSTIVVEFERLLRPYLSDSLATVVDDTAKVAEEGLALDDDWKGRVLVVFDEDLWLGCRDIGGTSEREADLPFEVDVQSGTLLVDFMDEQEREPDDL
ncbi:MAG TPA: hypothetical protein VGO27_13590 [Candidatus Acidoferrum sp.]|jgi:hypothetical protein|nr:hypothetical protein [Candidatus Acidoferrum sp.]